MQKTLTTRNRFRTHRLWLSLAAALLGVFAGYSVGRVSIRHSVEEHLSDYAERVMQRNEELGAEIAQVLTEAQRSTFVPCSDQDIYLLRRLTFAARFLKDVGRLQGNDFLCSATIGKLPAGIPLQSPDATLRSGYKVFHNHPLELPVGARGEIVAAGSADAVLSPDIYADFSQQPYQLAVGIPEWLNTSHLARAAATPSGGNASILRKPLTGIQDTATLPPGVLGSKGVVRIGDRIYCSRCSSNYAVCAAASIAVPEIWKSHQPLLLGYTVTGTLAGFSCAVGILLIGNQRRSHSNQLRRAILMGQLSVVYQPIVELVGHRIVGAEALARWTDEDGESIRPETIIALAEAEGFVSEITRFVLTRAMEEIRPILENQPNFRLSINLAPSDLADPRLLLLLDERLTGGPVKAANIAFELPERATSVREVAVAAIRRLRDRGHAIFIDDFGTGYSNLAYLTELHVDGIKINRSFIATIGTESVTASIVPQILAVARALDLSVVVQGIEREDQASYFAADATRILGQGWFFGLPVPAQGLAYLCAEKSE
jgi:sensor c-di-GMP phosphodiesterase-like protein